MYQGDIRLGDTLDFHFTTRRFSTGAPFTLAGTPTLAAYPDNSLTEVTAGITLTVDFDARTGLNQVRIVATGANGYLTGTNYSVVITAGTVDAVSVVGEVVGSFSIEKRSALMPTTAARTLDVSATGEGDANVVQIDGTALSAHAAGMAPADVRDYGGVAGTFSGGRPEVNTSHVGGTLQTAGDIIGDTNDLQARLPATLVGGRMRSEVESYAAGMTPTRPSASGTADSGSTTTVVDAERTEADTDYWRNCILKFTSGTLNGQTALITAFNPATDTITFAPATTVAVATHTYEIYPMARVDVHLWLGALVNALIAGRVPANAEVVGDKTGYSIGAGGIANTAFAAGAIDAAAIAADAIGASEIANGAIDAATFAVDAINAAALATDAVNEIRDAIRDLAMVEPTAVPAVTGTLRDVLSWLLVLSRNRVTQTASVQTLRNDANTLNIATAAVSDDGTTFARDEWA